MPDSNGRIMDGEKANFEMLKRAADNGDLAIVSAVREADTQRVALLCAVSWEGGAYSFAPLAMLLPDDNPYEAYRIDFGKDGE